MSAKNADLARFAASIWGSNPQTPARRGFAPLDPPAGVKLACGLRGVGV